MRVNIYAEEMTERIEIVSKEIDGHVFTGLRIYLELPASLPPGCRVAGPNAETAYAEPEMKEISNVRGPFIHRPGDDDSAAVTFWGKQSLIPVLEKALKQLREHYAKKEPI